MVTAHAMTSGNCDVTIYLFLELQTLSTANRYIEQKNGFHYHNLVFILNLIVLITHTSGRVQVCCCFPR